MKRLLLIMFACGVVGSSIVYGEPRQIDLDTMSKEELVELSEKISDKIAEIEETEENTGDNSVWQVNYYVDTFGYPTEEPYITTDPLDGKFSNTAVTNAKLTVRLLIDDTISVKLYEYGSSLVKGYYSKGERYDVYFRKSDGSEDFVVGYLNDGSDRVSFNEKASLRLLRAFRDYDSIVLVMYPSEHSATEYKFEIPDTSGFASLYELTFGSIEPETE